MHTSVNETVGANVTRLRRRREDDLSQVGLAGLMSAMLGKIIDPSTVNRLERGKRPVTAEELVALAGIFNVPAASLLEEPDPALAGQAYWEGRRRESEGRVAAHKVDLAELTRQAQIDADVGAAFSALNQSREKFDRAAVIQAINVFIQHREDVWGLRAAVGGFESFTVQRAVELAGVSRAIFDAARAEINALLPKDPDAQASSSVVEAAILEIVRDRLIREASEMK